MPLAPDALERYRSDALVALRAFRVDVERLVGQVRSVLGSRGAEIESVGQVGHQLAEHAYDPDDGELLNPEAEDMVTAIENGIVPDLEDVRERVLEPLAEFVEKLDTAIGDLDAVVAPPDGMERIMTPARVEREAERPRAARRTRRR